LKECLESVRESTSWTKKKAESKHGKGIGIACGFFVSGAGYPIYPSDTPHCTVVTKLNDVGGSVTVYSGAADIGQGSDTMLAMITAEVLGIPIDAVHVISGDTELTVDLGAYSSRTTLMTGNAAKEAAENLKKQILDVIAQKLDVPLEKLDFKKGYLQINDNSTDIGKLRHQYRMEHLGFKSLPTGDKLSFLEASRLAFIEKGTLVGIGQYKPPPLGGSFKGAAVGTSPAFSCSAQIAEVKVDLETGKIKIEKMTGAHDCGFAINKTQVEGQMQGSISMGLGEALMEEVKFDSCGKIINSNLAEYKIPTTLDVPALESIIVESNEPNGPFGAKEVGEGAILPTIPSIINAIYDATGIEVDELPLTSERIYNYLKKCNLKKL
jgi:CO/xanthine dehydrogenase Mo-binding subunit